MVNSEKKKQAIKLFGNVMRRKKKTGMANKKTKQKKSSRRLNMRHDRRIEKVLRTEIFKNNERSTNTLGRKIPLTLHKMIA